MKHFSRTEITAGELVDTLYKAVDHLNAAVAAVNDCDTTRWNDAEAVRRVWIAHDTLDKLYRQMAVRARLVPRGMAPSDLGFTTLDAIAAGIQQRSDRSEYGEDQDLQETLNKIARAVGMPSDARDTGQAE